MKRTPKSADSAPSSASPGATAGPSGFSDHAAQAFGAYVAESWKSLSALKLPWNEVVALQGDYVKQATELWNTQLQASGSTPPPADRRFAAPEWGSQPANTFLAQLYLLNARTLLGLADHLEGDEKTRQRVRFAVQQWVDAAAPSNFLALNPEAQRKAIETQGQSIAQGITHLLSDLKQGHLSQTDESKFEVGRNVATTEGAVVFENALFQLIEYKPLTGKVHAVPMLFVPPCINKFYILDLQPTNSLIRYTVEQGHRLFVVSWRNPDESLEGLGWDDYIEDAAIRAITEVRAITGSERINTLGFCVGGTILSTALAVLAARGQHPAASVTLLTTFLDFADTGVLDLFIDEAMVQMRELTLGEANPNGPKLLKGGELASTFSFLRPNDLVWNYVVGNYLKGETPPAFDLLYWNGDSTNLPGPMYCWYLRNTYLENNLVKPGYLTVCGEKLDLGLINAPVYIYASREDHIVPWAGAYRNLKALSGTKGRARFVLGASGHIAGVINPPAQKKRCHWIGHAASYPASAQAWLDRATEHPGSWWPDWAQWLTHHAGAQVAAPKAFGDRRHRAIEPAPGRYVLQKA